MPKQFLSESASSTVDNYLSESVAASANKQSNKRWLVTIAKPGKGSTGFYSAEMLAEYGPIAFPAGTRSYLNHARPEDRDVRDIVGVFPEGAYWDGKTQSLMAVLETRNPKWDEFIAAAHDAIDMSMFVMDFDKDEQGNITRLGHTRANSVDVVGIGGIEGAGFTELVESAREYDFSKTSLDDTEEKRKKMEIEELAKKVDSLTAVVETLNSRLSENATAEAQVKADEEAASIAAAEALESYRKSEALIEAAKSSLTESQIETLRETAVKGEEIEALIESFKKHTEEAREGFVNKDELSEGYRMSESGGYTSGSEAAKKAFGGK